MVLTDLTAFICTAEVPKKMYFPLSPCLWRMTAQKRRINSKTFKIPDTLKASPTCPPRPIFWNNSELFQIQIQRFWGLKNVSRSYDSMQVRFKMADNVFFSDTKGRFEADKVSIGQMSEMLTHASFVGK